LGYSIQKKYMSRVVSETKVVFFDVATDDSTHVTTRQTKVPSGGFDPLTGVQEIVDNVLFYYHGGPLFFPTDLYMSEKLPRPEQVFFTINLLSCLYRFFNCI
jgi:hypothetical protein